MSKPMKSYFMETKYIVENAPQTNPNIIGKFKATLAKADAVSQNHTMYSRDLWESVLNSDGFKNKLNGKLILGELDHPADPDTSLKRVSHVVTEAWIDKDGLVWGNCEILNTEPGKILNTLIGAGIKVGFSSRALGEEEYTREGVKKIKKEGFNLLAWDAVWDASVQGSEFKEWTESKKKYVTESLKYIKDPIAESVLKELSKQEVEKKLEAVRFEVSTLKMLNESKEKVAKDAKFQLESTIIQLNEMNSKLKELTESLNKKDQEIQNRDSYIQKIEESTKTMNTKLSIYENEINEKNMLIEKKNKELEQLTEAKKTNEYTVVLDTAKVNGYFKKESSLVSRMMNKPKYN